MAITQLAESGFSASTTAEIPEELQIVPQTIWFIPDGNRRWAKKNGYSDFQGHQRGFKAVLDLARFAKDLGIKEITVWGFSRKNWNRPPAEIKYLMNIIYPLFIEKHLEELHKIGTRFRTFGDRSRIPANLIKKIEKAEGKTAKDDKFQVNILLDYDGPWHTAQVAERLSGKRQKITAESLLMEMEKDLRPPDMIIRTSGETRLSGLESPLTAKHDAEIIFAPEYLPEYTKEAFLRDLLLFSNKERRHGK